MIHLTDKHIAVEIPEDATEVELTGENAYSILCCTKTEKFGVKNIILKDNGKLMIMDIKPILVGVTPITEEQWDTIVFKFGQYGYMNYLVKPQFGGYPIKNSIESGISLLKSKGLDPNKKYAIIKIEKE